MLIIMVDAWLPPVSGPSELRVELRRTSGGKGLESSEKTRAPPSDASNLHDAPRKTGSWQATALADARTLSRESKPVIITMHGSSAIGLRVRRTRRSWRSTLSSSRESMSGPGVAISPLRMTR